MSAAPKAVLFACNHNTVRSPMAAALFAQATGAPAVSCGLNAGDHVNGFAAAVMAEAGVDLLAHEPRSFEDVVDYPDLIVALTAEAAERAGRVEGVPVEVWPIDDPTLVEGSREQQLDAFRGVRDDLRARIGARFA
jgi:protein-tyrosine-phosphatase